jgi:hypothetical protein
MSEKVTVKVERSVLHLPAIALRGLVVFPNNLLHFEVGREKSIAAVEWAVSNNSDVFLVAQKEMKVEDPKAADLYTYGVVAEVKQVMRVSDDLVRILVEGKYRAKLSEMEDDGSFLLATRPLTPSEVAATLPGNRTCVTSLNIGNYFRLAPDNRLIFGGRARFSARSDQQSDAKSGQILRRAMAGIFPHLAEVEVDYCWGGLVDMTQDRYPRAGQADGLWYAMGYSGHGAQIATHLGQIMADRIMGRDDGNPFADLPWAAVPFHTGKPWFLPLVGLYYKAKDMLQ